MASVYLAYDRKHQREVAIKVLLPDLAAAIGSTRFLTEIQIVARLNHPHVLGMHDSGETGGFLYYVMPFVEGGSLRQRLPQGRRLEPGEALAIAAAAPRRRYSGGEVQEIVKCASELEATNPTTGDSMTIGGVEALAREVGIAPELVRSAARSVTGRRPDTDVAPLETPARNPWLGAATRLVYDRVVAGELSNADFPVLVDEIRRRTGNVGQVGTLGRSLSWTVSQGLGGARRDLEIMVDVRRGRTRITIQENLGRLIGVTFGPIGGAMGGGGFGIIFSALMAAHLPILVPIVIPAWPLATYGTARTVYKENAARRTRELEALADSLAALTVELIAERSLPP